jgi:hypothetical protein
MEKTSSVSLRGASRECHLASQMGSFPVFAYIFSQLCRRHNVLSVEGKFDANGTFQLAQWDDVRIYESRKRLGWQISVQEILYHMIVYEKECSQLDSSIQMMLC